MHLRKIPHIPANPVKSFFVHMLTRDIELQDAILDLLDNCVDGIQRAETKRQLSRRLPYEGYWASIEFDGTRFRIEDNCGGIPVRYHDYAFRMGRIKADIDKGKKTIGTYGIGMKRAIFKMGADCTIRTHAKDGSYRLRLSPQWISKEDDWLIPVVAIKPAETLGTTLEIRSIYSSVRTEFESGAFERAFREAVATHYAYIIGKGFEVRINGKAVTPRSISLLFAEEAVRSKHPIMPFIYEGKHDGVDVFLVVGFTSPIPSREEADEGLENYKERYSSAEAGWTVICNDRTVVYCDKTPLTGWGVSGVPQYHMQFIAISGIVIFSADDANLLPMTTTKRGIEASSPLYLQVRDKMIEGTKMFTQYTNQWKGKDLVAKSRCEMRSTHKATLDEIRTRALKLHMTATRGAVKGKQYKPVLPRPDKKKTTERIVFTRAVRDVRRVSQYIFDSPDRNPSNVGARCFDVILEEARE
ncbi:MAG TPA: ATP-binding protein [bacterium]|nr:ATP-binding protein [bacterium]HPQ65697.1 ATP-binding protein [bacterium]